MSVKVNPLKITIQSLYMTLCDEEDEEVVESMSKQDMLTEIYSAYNDLKRELKELQNEVDELEDDKSDLSDKVDSLLKTVNTGLYEPIDLELELYRLHISNPFTPPQMIAINNHLNDKANVEIVIF